MFVFDVNELYRVQFVLIIIKKKKCLLIFYLTHAHVLVYYCF